jgi:hypothetical protein
VLLRQKPKGEFCGKPSRNASTYKAVLDPQRIIGPRQSTASGQRLIRLGYLLVKGIGLNLGKRLALALAALQKIPLDEICAAH